METDYQFFGDIRFFFKCYRYSSDVYHAIIYRVDRFQGKPIESIEFPDTVSHNNVDYTVVAIEGSENRQDVYKVVTDRRRKDYGKKEFVCTEYIGKKAVCDTSVRDVKLPSTLQWIGESAFANCHNLTSIDIPDGVETIGEYAFYNTGAVFGKITIPASVKIIRKMAFYCRDAHTILDVRNKNGAIEIDSSALSSHSKVKYIGEKKKGFFARLFGK